MWARPASDQDAAIYLVAAFTGLRRGELLALRWRDVDFGGSTIRGRSSYAAGQLTTPKSGKVPAVPMAPHVPPVSPRACTVRARPPEKWLFAVSFEPLGA